MTDRNARWALSIACVAFVGLGSFGASIGPLLSELAEQTASPLAAAGGIFTALAVGGTLASLGCGPIGDRIGQQTVLRVGLLIMMFAPAGILASRSLPALLACAALAGVGHGTVSFSGNLLVATSFGRRNTTPLNFLHLCFSLGAVLGPAGVSLCLGLWSTGRPALALPMLVAVVLLPAGYKLHSPHRIRESAPTSGVSVYRTPLLWTFAAFLGVFVGVQLGMGGWTATYLTRTTGMPRETAALVTSGYWLAQSLGRLIATLTGGRLSPYRILALDLAGGCIAATTLLLGIGHDWLTVGGILLLGLGFGSIYPTTVALLTATFRSSPGKAASIVMTSGSLANMVLPPLQGVLLINLGAASTPWFAMIGSVLMTVLLTSITRSGARSAAREPAQA